VQRFISGLPKDCQNKIEFDKPKTLEDTIQKARYCYEHLGLQTEPREGWKQKNSSGFHKKGFRPPRFKNYKKDSMVRFLS
jgi:hypothetical protein